MLFLFCACIRLVANLQVAAYHGVAQEWKEIEKTEIARFLEMEQKLNKAKCDCIFLKKEGTDSVCLYLTLLFIVSRG
jgi:hypothetical protein